MAGQTFLHNHDCCLINVSANGPPPGRAETTALVPRIPFRPFALLSVISFNDASMPRHNKDRGVLLSPQDFSLDPACVPAGLAPSTFPLSALNALIQQQDRAVLFIGGFNGQFIPPSVRVTTARPARQAQSGRHGVMKAHSEHSPLLFIASHTRGNIIIAAPVIET